MNGHDHSLPAWQAVAPTWLPRLPTFDAPFPHSGTGLAIAAVYAAFYLLIVVVWLGLVAVIGVVWVGRAVGLTRRRRNALSGETAPEVPRAGVAAAAPGPAATPRSQPGCAACGSP